MEPNRRRPLAVWLLALPFALLASSAGPQTADTRGVGAREVVRASVQKPSFPAEAALVTVDVLATDRHGEPVQGLRREDFTISDDGVPQTISAFEAVSPELPAPGSTSTGALRPLVPRSASNREPAARLGSHFVIVFDELHLDPAEAVRARRAVEQFLGSGVSDGDRVALVGTAEGTRWAARLPEGRESLRLALRRLQPRLLGESVRDRMTDYEAMRIDRDRDPLVTDVVMRRLLDTTEIQQDTASPGNPALSQSDQVGGWRADVLSRAAGVYARATARNEQALGVVERALASLALERGRKALLFVSGGLVQDPRLGIYRRVVNEALRVNAAVYFVDARGLSAATEGMQGEIGTRTEFRDLGSWFTEARERGEGSDALAADTGGLSLRDRNDLGPALARIGRDARSYYLLGYVPTNRTADGRFHPISVRVAREGVTLRARRGYYASAGARGDEPAARGRDAAIQQALDSPFDLDGLPLRAISDVLGPAGEPGTATVRVTVEADVRALQFAEKEGTARDTLELLLLVAREDTGAFSRFDQQFEMSLRPETRERYERTGFPIVRELPLAPGRYQARIVARDANSGRIGSLGFTFDVPPLDGLRVSSLELTDHLREATGGAPAPEVTAGRRFASAGTLHCQFEVYGAALDKRSGRPDVTAGFSIRRQDGRVLAAMPESPLHPAADGALARRFGVPLDSAPPGNYELIVVVTDLAAGRTAESREAFVIEPRSGERP